MVNIFAEFAFKETCWAQLHAQQQWLPCKWTVRIPFPMQIGFWLRMIMRIVSTQIKIATTRISATTRLLVLPEIAQCGGPRPVTSVIAYSMHIFYKSGTMRENRAAASFKPER